MRVQAVRMPLHCGSGGGLPASCSWGTVAGAMEPRAGLLSAAGCTAVAPSHHPACRMAAGWWVGPCGASRGKRCPSAGLPGPASAAIPRLCSRHAATSWAGPSLHARSASLPMPPPALCFPRACSSRAVSSWATWESTCSSARRCSGAFLDAVHCITACAAFASLPALRRVEAPDAAQAAPLRCPMACGGMALARGRTPAIAAPAPGCLLQPQHSPCPTALTPLTGRRCSSRAGAVPMPHLTRRCLLHPAG